MGVANVPAASAAGLQPKYQKFTSSGTFTLPTGYGVSKPLLISIQVIGGGGGGVSFVTNNNGNKIGEARMTNYHGAAGGYDYYGLASNYLQANSNGKGGGSGGLASTQMYLTSNLTITVGAKGTRNQTTYAWVTANTRFRNDLNNNNPVNNIYNTGTLAGGTGGTSTAGSVSAGGGAGATTNITYRGAGQGSTNIVSSIAVEISAKTDVGGAGGFPAGTQGDATPLLGTIAGGSGTSTAVFGSFGIGGIKTDGTSSTGVEGTGGGHDADGASGAVIITWWE